MADHTRPAHLRDLGDGDMGAWTPFQFKDALKSIPGSRWDVHLRCWRIPYRFAAEANAVIDAANGGVDMELVGAFRTVLARLEHDLAKRVYRACAGALHPDAGGHEAAMQALTAAWREVGS